MIKKLLVTALGSGLCLSAIAQPYNPNMPNQNDRPPMNSQNNNWNRHDDNNRNDDNRWNSTNNYQDNKTNRPPPVNDRWDGRWKGNYDQNDRNHWQQGRWQRGRHNGVDGWWWIVGGLWYYYTQPVYPYPEMGIPPDIYRPGINYSNVRYYCPVSHNYYPYVTTCRVAWQRR